jgi:hypothetical protein
MLNLTINHNIHVNRQQRYALYDGESVEVIGISLPVWLKNGITSEPAKEIFCRYILKNATEEKPINVLPDGYEITLPYRPKKSTTKLPDRLWLKWTMTNPDALANYYDKRVREISCHNLLDTVDGGSKCLYYREQNQIMYEGQLLNVVHYIQIEDIDELLKSIC